MLNRPVAALAMSVMTVCGAFAQKTTNFTFTMNISEDANTATGHALGSAFSVLSPLGPVAVNLDLTQPVDRNDTSIGLDNYKGLISFVFNRLDSFDVSVTIPNGTGNPAGPVNGTITGGKGAYQGATGSVAFIFTGVNGPRSQALKFGGYTISATGNVTVAGKTTALSLPNTGMAPFGSGDIFRDGNSGNATFTPLGSGTLSITGAGGDNNTRQAVVATVKFNNNDSLAFFFSFLGDTPPANTPGVVAGGTGVYAGATGSVTFTVSVSPDGNSITASGGGSVTTGATGIPVITEVTTAFGYGEISPNGWMVVKGTNLVPATTPATGVIWSNAPEFASGKMPTNLQGISVSVNGVPAYVYFYCSAATDKDCATDQINVLSPLDAIGDNIPAGVVVTNGSVSSAAFTVNEVSFAEPSFLLFDTKGHVVGVHLDGGLLGPTALYPGLSTPAKVGETVLLYLIGYGLPKGGATQGSATQVGAVQAMVNCSIEGRIVQNVPANIISPGLTQLNLTIPTGTPIGDNLILCAGGFTDGTSGHTPAGNLITVQ